MKEELMDRLLADIYQYHFVGGMEEIESLIDLIMFYLDEIDGNRFSEKMVDVDLVKKVFTERIPAETPIIFDEAVFCYLALMDLYFELYQMGDITEEAYQSIQTLLQQEKNLFFKRMVDVRYWSKNKKRMLNQLTDDSIEELANTAIGFLQDVYVEEPSNVIQFPNSNQKMEASNLKGTVGFQIRVDLEGYKPPIWRRFLLPADTTFLDLHNILQIGFNWENSHLHVFKADNMLITDPRSGLDFDFDEGNLAVEVIFQNANKLMYIYDFGADWIHQIKIEKIFIGGSDEAIFTPKCSKLKGEVPVEDTFDPEETAPGDLKMINQEIEEYWVERTVKF